MMTNPRRISYAFIFLLLVFVGWLHVATPLITVLFAYFTLQRLHQACRSKPAALAAYMVLALVAGYAVIYFAGQAFRAVPDIASTIIPEVLRYAHQFGLELPFEDYDSLKLAIVDYMKADGLTNDFQVVKRVLGFAAFEVAALIIGLVVAASLFMSTRFDLEHEAHTDRNNLYALSWVEIAERFRLFYQSFATVMGAQILISTINTSLTAIYIVTVGLKHPFVLIFLTFVCGMLPILGNIMSNTLIVGVALTVSPKLAVLSLIFLVVLHKLEYFLNSKIIGGRIKNPMWLTLLGLVLGERLMGIPGMILAPVVLHYVKVEASRNILTAEERGETSPPPPAA